MPDSIDNLQQMICSSAPYQATLNKLPAKVCTLADGRQISHEEIARAGIASYAKLRQQPEYALLCGGKPGKQRRRAKALRAAAKADVAQQYGLALPNTVTLWLAGLATFIGVVFGPVVLFTVILESVLGWLVEKELSDEFDLNALMP